MRGSEEARKASPIEVQPGCQWPVTPYRGMGRGRLASVSVRSTGGRNEGRREGTKRGRSTATAAAATAVATTVATTATTAKTATTTPPPPPQTLCLRAPQSIRVRRKAILHEQQRILGERKWDGRLLLCRLEVGAGHPRCGVMWRASEEEHTTRFGSGQPRLSDLMVGGISTPTTATLSWVRSLSKACLHPAYSMCHPSLAGPTAAALDVDWALLDLGRDVAVGEVGEIPCLPVSAVSA
jgi:hypothetical protein